MTHGILPVRYQQLDSESFATHARGSLAVTQVADLTNCVPPGSRSLRKSSYVSPQSGQTVYVLERVEPLHIEAGVVDAWQFENDFTADQAAKFLRNFDRFRAISQFTLETGHSSHFHCPDELFNQISTIGPWLETALAAGGPIPLIGEGLAPYSAQAVQHSAVLEVTVYAPRAPHAVGTTPPLELQPLIKMGVARDEESGNRLWRTLLGDTDTVGPPHERREGRREPGFGEFTLSLNELVPNPDNPRWTGDPSAWASVTPPRLPLPWLLVSLKRALDEHRSPCEWLADFERTVAWAWLWSFVD